MIPPRSWQQFPNGLVLRNQIERVMRDFLEDCEGDRLLAVGPLAHELNMSSCKVKQRIRLDWQEGDFVDLVAEPSSLPLEGESIDIMVLPLLLDYAEDPHQILREAKRVLSFAGKLCILSFNQKSLWGLRHFITSKNANPLWQAKPLSARRVEDWLELLQLKVHCSLSFGSMLPWKMPINSTPDWLSDFSGKQNFMGGFQLIWAEKQLPVITPLQQRWKKFKIKGSAEVNVREKINS